jgi:hypothetical protein
LLLEQSLKLLTVARQNLRLAARSMVLGRQIPDPSPLLQQLLDHPQRDSKPLSHLGSRFPESVVTGDDPFPDIQADGFHTAPLPKGGLNGYIIS